jgi:hypothetical protein
MTSLVRTFLALEAALFAGAALIHAGVLAHGYEHARAETAEGVIALVLAGGLAAALVAPGSSRGVGLAVQGFALLGTLVGLFTIAIGIGPRTALDLILHMTMILLLLTGLWFVGRRRITGNLPVS